MKLLPNSAYFLFSIAVQVIGMTQSDITNVNRVGRTLFNSEFDCFIHLSYGFSMMVNSQCCCEVIYDQYIYINKIK